MARAVMIALVLAAIAAANVEARPQTPADGVPPPKPSLSPITADFVDSERATHYVATITSAKQPPAGSFVWSLAPPADDPNCKVFVLDATVRPGSGIEEWEVRAVWKHSADDGCAHTTPQHNGTVTLTVKLAPVTCVASYFGTQSNTGSDAVCTEKDCSAKAAAVAAARAKVVGLEQERRRLGHDLDLAEGMYKLIDHLLTTAKPEVVKKAGKSGLDALQGLWDARNEVEALDAEVEKLDEAIPKAQAELAKAEAELAKCEGRHLAGVRGSCDAQLSASAAATARRDTLAFVRRTVPARRVTSVRAATNRASRAVHTLIAKPGLGFLKPAVPRVDAAARLLGQAQAASRRLDADLKAARTRATGAAAALASCGG